MVGRGGEGRGGEGIPHPPTPFPLTAAEATRVSKPSAVSGIGRISHRRAVLTRALECVSAAGDSAAMGELVGVLQNTPTQGGADGGEYGGGGGGVHWSLWSELGRYRHGNGDGGDGDANAVRGVDPTSLKVLQTWACLDEACASGDTAAAAECIDDDLGGGGSGGGEVDVRGDGWRCELLTQQALARHLCGGDGGGGDGGGGELLSVSSRLLVEPLSTMHAQV